MGLFKDLTIDTIDHDRFNNIVSDLDGGTQTDEEFCKVFTKKVFKLFGTK